ncbi:hypothetical protein [Acidianus ambivalens]|uniref:Uncharacterized protein n=1 Tax=Acidianus ambivalens TaxID=2283 RepID=A0A650CUM6_ACIAM|nr:hypothetical protein [Acidianus ambivalens]MQL56101.1 hypothetical protein [Acidianus ambivalens]QGR21352.1 hypothetical protein D1866_04605 [Acidianus ambivalens]
MGGKCAIADLVGGLIQLFIGLPLAIFSITLAQREIYRFFAHKMSGKMETFYINTELKNGNIAIAAMLFGAFYATSAVISQAVGFLSQPIVAALSQM